MKRQDEDYDEQVEESLQDEVSLFGELFNVQSTRMKLHYMDMLCYSVKA